MKKLTLFALSFALLSGIVSCDNDNKKEDPAPTGKTALLTSKKWRMIAYTTLQDGATTSTDVYVVLPECFKDDFLKFNADKTSTLNEGEIKCKSDSPQSVSTTWDFNSDQTQLIIANAPAVADILELSSSTLKLQYKTLGTAFIYTYTAF